jgi:FO synthase
MGLQGAQACLQAGANDIGGTLMNESITRAAGAIHGQEMTPETLEAVIRDCGRRSLQRNTLYDASPAREVLRERPELKVQVV